ncbi:hypothetical protein V4P56_03915 [Bartonella sp. B35(2025)]
MLIFLFFPTKPKGYWIRRLNNLPLIGTIGIVSFALISITNTFILWHRSNDVFIEDEKLLLVDKTSLPICPERELYLMKINGDFPIRIN